MADGADDLVSRDALTDEITVALIEARRDGQRQGIQAIRDLRARLDLLEPGPAVDAYKLGFREAIQSARAEAATVLANLTRTHTPTPGQETP